MELLQDPLILFWETLVLEFCKLGDPLGPVWLHFLPFIVKV